MNSEFIITLHVLVYLKHHSTEVSSEGLAGNICTNPAHIRKVMAELRKTGLLETRKGDSGGYELQGNASTTKLSDLAQALQRPLTKSRWRSGTLSTYCMAVTGTGTAVDTLEASLNEVCMQSFSQITVKDVNQQLIIIKNHKNKKG